MVEEKVISILSRLCCIDKKHISCDTTFSELGMDSLDSVELALTLEDEFQVEIPFIEFEFNIVKDITDFIEKRLLMLPEIHPHALSF